MDELDNMRHFKRELLHSKLRIKDAEAKLVFTRMRLAQLRRQLRLHN